MFIGGGGDFLVGLVPILTPSILGTIILLFGNALGAQATAYQLTSGQIPLVTVIIGAQISGDVLHNEGLGYALATRPIARKNVTSELPP